MRGDAVRVEISRVRESARCRKEPHDSIKEYLVARRVARRGNRATRAGDRVMRRERDLTAMGITSH